MTNVEFSVVEINGDRVKAISGQSSDEARSEFAREAEGLQARAYLLGTAIGMTAVSGVAVTHGTGGLAFRFARNSSEEFDAKGLLVDGDQFEATSLLEQID